MPFSGQAKRDYQRQWVANRRAEYLDGRACVLCGSREQLEFDHANPSQKISHRIWSWSRERVEAELAKCVILCRRCHQERHSLERPKHGSGGYKRGCRCGVCVQWKRESTAKYNERRRRESDPGTRLCRPVHSHSATAPNVPLVISVDPSICRGNGDLEVTSGTIPVPCSARECGFCHGQPVGDAASWLDGKPRPPAPCPRCGETNQPEATE